jgi:hypothetical protein
LQTAQGKESEKSFPKLTGFYLNVHIVFFARLGNGFTQLQDSPLRRDASRLYNYP